MKKAIQTVICFLLMCMLFFTMGCSSNASENAEPTGIEQTEKATQVLYGWVRGRVLLEDGALSVAGIIVEDAEGNIWRTTTDVLSGFELELEAGDYKLTFTHGPEYETVTEQVTVKGYAVQRLPDITLTQQTDLYSKGWIAGDLHMHTTYSDGADSVSQQLLSNISQGLYFGFLTDHNTIDGLIEWFQGNTVSAYTDAEGQTRDFGAFNGNEITTQFGHYQALGVEIEFDENWVVVTDDDKDDNGESDDEALKEKIIYIAQQIREAGGVPQINHPYSTRDMGFHYWEIADYFDTIEIWNGVFVPGDGRYESEDPNNLEQNYRSKLKWYELLNEVKNGGKFHAATGGTDNHNTASPYTPYMEVDQITNMDEYNEVYRRNGKYSGVPTTYVYCPDGITQEKVLEALVAGHSFISNGVTVLSDVNGASYGDTAVITNEMMLNVDIFSREGLEKLAVIKNGETLQEIVMEPGTQSYNQPVMLNDLQEGDWIVLEVFGTETRYAITNPIFFVGE